MSKKQKYFEKEEHSDLGIGIIIVVISSILLISSFILAVKLDGQGDDFGFFVAMCWIIISFFAFVVGGYFIISKEVVKYEIKENEE